MFRISDVLHQILAFRTSTVMAKISTMHQAGPNMDSGCGGEGKGICTAAGIRLAVGACLVKE